MEIFVFFLLQLIIDFFLDEIKGFEIGNKTKTLRF